MASSIPLEEVREVRFVVVKGANPGAVVSFDPTPRTIRIGRAVDNDIVVNDPTVSRRHASVALRADAITIQDEGSSSGVEKMGFRLGSTAEPLESGDEIRIGDSILRFELVLKKGALDRLAQREATKSAAAGAPAASGPLARLGLSSRPKLLAVGALLVALLALLAWPEDAGLPPQASNVPRAIDYTALVGFTGNARSHLDGAIFELPTDAEGVALSFDLLAPSGVELRVDRRPIATVEGANGWRAHQLLAIPRALTSQPKARLSLDNLGFSPNDSFDAATLKPWGVTRMWIARVPSAASTPRSLARELEGLEELARRADEATGNRYKLLAGMRRVALGFMKLSGRAAVLVTVPASPEQSPEALAESVRRARIEIEAERSSDALDGAVAAIARLEAEIRREHRRLSNAVALAEKRGEKREQIVSLIRIGRLVPEPTDPRHRLAVARLGKLGARLPAEER